MVDLSATCDLSPQSFYAFIVLFFIALNTSVIGISPFLIVFQHQCGAKQNPNKGLGFVTAPNNVLPLEHVSQLLSSLSLSSSEPNAQSKQALLCVFPQSLPPLM